jgi:hypothetical protein
VEAEDDPSSPDCPRSRTRGFDRPANRITEFLGEGRGKRRNAFAALAQWAAREIVKEAESPVPFKMKFTPAGSGINPKHRHQA